MQGSARVGTIFGTTTSTSFQIAVADPSLQRLEYVQAAHGSCVVLGQIAAIERESSMAYEDALAGHGGGQERIKANVDVVGYRDDGGMIAMPTSPFAGGTPVVRASARLVSDVLGLATRTGGAYVGHLRGTTIPVSLTINDLAQRHLSVLAKTGAGKSYTVGVILEELLAAGVPLVIIDPHGEYASLGHPNMDQRDLAAMARYDIRPRAFHKNLQEFAVDTGLNPGAKRLVLDGMNLEAREIQDLLTGLSGGQTGVLYQAVKEVAENRPAYGLEDIAEAVARNPSSARWNVVNALEALQATKLFGVQATKVTELVRPGRCTILNLKGLAPDLQGVVVTRVAGLLWEARKRDEAPPHILVVEEAHNYCPERGVGKAQSGPVLRTIASEGRKFGLGLFVISQRPAKVEKNVLSQCHTQIILRLTNPNDLKAVSSGVEGLTAAATDEIQRLPVGVALVAGGGLTQPINVDVRPRRSAHGGASIDIVAASEADDPDGQPMMGDAEPAVGQSAPVDVKEPAPAMIETVSVAEQATPLAPDERRAVARVLARVGVLVGGEDHLHERLLRIAEVEGSGWHDTVRFYVDVARVACHEETPHCARCPLSARCEQHLSSLRHRQESRSVIRRLWRS